MLYEVITREVPFAVQALKRLEELAGVRHGKTAAVVADKENRNNFV